MNEDIKNQPYNKKTNKTVFYVLFIIFLFGSGFFVGQRSQELSSASIADVILGNKEQAPVEGVDLDIFWKTWKTIDEKYPKASEISANERVYGAIKGLTESLNDPYTTFFTPEEQKAFKEELSGSFSGVGMEVGIKDDVLTVISPIKGTPAYSSGLRPGDKIISIDKESTANMSVDQAVKKIRGEANTNVVLEIFREGSKQTEIKTITRQVINIPNIEHYLRDDGVYVIKLFSFNDESDTKFKDAVYAFHNSGSNKLIFDLRGNPGGYLNSAVNIASWFVEAGKVIVKEDYGANKDPDIFVSRGYDLLKNKEINMVILIDKGSASASEIVTGALKEYKIATVVGEKSFGKGSVQELVPIDDKTSLKITIADWLTPNGVSISKEGINPDIVIRNTNTKVDAQFNKALEIVNKK